MSASKVFSVMFLDAFIRALEMSQADMGEVAQAEGYLDDIIDDTGFDHESFEKMMEDWAIRVATMAAARAKSGP